jgi:hypothetical protein
MLIYHSRAVSLSLYKMIRELATKKLASPSRNHLHIDATMFSKGISRKREIHPEGSKNVDALKPNFEEEDSEIEISGPFPLSFKPESTKIIPRTGLKHAVVQKANDKPCVFFSVHGDIQLRISVYTLSSVLIYHMHPAMARTLH